MMWPLTSIGSRSPFSLSGNSRSWAASRAVYITPLIRTRSPAFSDSTSASLSGVVISLIPSAAVVTLMLRRPSYGVHDGVERRAGAHRLRHLVGARPEVPADVDRLPLRGVQLG